MFLKIKNINIFSVLKMLVLLINKKYYNNTLKIEKQNLNKILL